jgi:hypothetical protein
VGSKAAQERQNEPRHHLVGSFTVAPASIAGPATARNFTLTSTDCSRPARYNRHK